MSVRDMWKSRRVFGIGCALVQCGELKFCAWWSHREVVVWRRKGWTQQMLSNGQPRGQED